MNTYKHRRLTPSECPHLQKARRGEMRELAPGPHRLNLLHEMKGLIVAHDLDVVSLNGTEAGAEEGEVSYSGGVSGLLNYITRAAMIYMREENAVLLPDAPVMTHAHNLLDYFQYFGLSDMPQDHLVHVEQRPNESFASALWRQHKRLKRELKMIFGNDYEDVHYHNYMVGPGHERFAKEGLGVENTCSAEAIRWGNNKGAVMAALGKAGVSVPWDKPVRDMEEAAHWCRRLWKRGVKDVYLKANESASGMGTFPIRNEIELQAFLENTEAQLVMKLGGFSVQKGVPEHLQLASPGFLMWIGDNDEEDTFLGDSDQILSAAFAGGPKTVHEGNRGPAPWRHLIPGLRHDLKKIARVLRAKGIRGLVGLDAIVFWNPKKQDLDYVFIDPNIRVSGQLQAVLKALELNQPYFACDNNLKLFKEEDFEEAQLWLDEQGLSYQEGSGVVLEKGDEVLEAVVYAKDSRSADHMIARLKTHPKADKIRWRVQLVSSQRPSPDTLAQSDAAMTHHRATLKRQVNLSLNDYLLYLERAGVAYDPGTRTGVIIGNWATISSGKIQITVHAASAEKRDEMLAVARAFKTCYNSRV